MADRIEMEDGDRLPTSKGAARPRWGRRMLTLLIAVAAIGGFAMIVVYSYDKGGDAGMQKTAPVITAQKEPIKTRPESPGGMAVPNQDKQIYGQIDSAKMPKKVERLLPPPEPIMTQPPPETANKTPPPAAADSERVARRMNGIEPSAGKPEVPPPPPAAAPAAQLAAKSPAAKPAEKPTGKSSASPSAMPQKTANAAEPPRGASSRASGWRIQIASLRSEQAAKAAWTRLTKQNGDLFGKLPHRIVRIDLAGKGTFYRLQAGPLADAAQARTLCSRVKKRKIGCFVVRP